MIQRTKGNVKQKAEKHWIHGREKTTKRNERWNKFHSRYEVMSDIITKCKMAKRFYSDWKKFPISKDLWGNFNLDVYYFIKTRPPRIVKNRNHLLDDWLKVKEY